MTKSYHVLNTDWGFTVAVWSALGLWELTFPRATAEAALADVTTADIAPGGQTAMATALERELKLFFSGGRVGFGAPIDWNGYTPFQRAVLQYTATSIPFGQVTTYGQLAAAVGAPGAARAVGGALHINRTPVVVPCHRVVGAKGKLVGFGGGLDLKKALLLLEDEAHD